MTGEAGTLRFNFGAEVDCTDGHCGRVRLVVVDVNARPSPILSWNKATGDGDISCQSSSSTEPGRAYDCVALVASSSLSGLPRR